MSAPDVLWLDSLPKTLCQPDDTKGCGVCCGMYNDRHHRGAHDTMSALMARTVAYRATASIQDEASLAKFRRQWEPAPSDKLLDGLPACPFLGLITWRQGDQRPLVAHKVGCLVHPLQNEGEDGRDCGVYDRRTCDEYLCAAHSLLTKEERWLVLTAVKDSYLYGLVITDTTFVRQLFRLAATDCGAYPTFSRLRRPESVEMARVYFELKRQWPWQAVDGVFGQVEGAGGLEVKRREQVASQMGVAAAPEDAVLQCLGTKVRDVEGLAAARALVRQRIAAFAQAVAP